MPLATVDILVTICGADRGGRLKSADQAVFSVGTPVLPILTGTEDPTRGGTCLSWTSLVKWVIQSCAKANGDLV